VYEYINAERQIWKEGERKPELVRVRERGKAGEGAGDGAGRRSGEGVGWERAGAKE